MDQTISCQVQGINKNLWLKFRQMALSEGVSASGKVRAMIEAAVAASDVASLEKGMSNER
ncbi:MAG: hypothetical protein ABSA33_05505 [Candidatus Micrarchaeaceae archaeon]|jgi:hypothetical protein